MILEKKKEEKKEISLKNLILMKVLMLILYHQLQDYIMI